MNLSTLNKLNEEWSPGRIVANCRECNGKGWRLIVIGSLVRTIDISTPCWKCKGTGKEPTK